MASLVQSRIVTVEGEVLSLSAYRRDDGRQLIKVIDCAHEHLNAPIGGRPLANDFDSSINVRKVFHEELARVRSKRQA